MALFKIFKGKKINLPKTYSEGYCYFTEDDGKFYIDTTSNASGRVALNAEHADSADTATKANNATYATSAGAADKATSLANSRSFSLSGGVVSTPQSFNGTSSVQIPVTQIKESYLDWGGRNFTAAYGCIDAAMIPRLGTNRFPFMNPDGIIIEYSRDGGNTWVDYGCFDAEKTNLFTDLTANIYIGGTNQAQIDKSNYQVRVTIVSDVAYIYTTLNKFVIYCATYNSTGCWCSIDARTATNYNSGNDTWVNFANKVPIAGWSDFNVINTSPLTTYGYAGIPERYKQLRFTFGVASHSSTSSYPGLCIKQIMGFGGAGWKTPSNLAKTGHLYSYDSLQNAFFPSSITATSFVGKATSATSADIATVSYGLKSESSRLNSQEKIDNFITAGTLKYGVFQTSSSNNIGMSNNDGVLISIPWDNSSSYGSQIAIDDSLIKVRCKSSSWGDWSTFLLSSNYTDYTVTKEGEGAIGTWGINITGNAASATRATTSGSADTATKLSSNAGSSTQPIYFSNGVPVACTYSLSKSVPSDAIFTDKNVNQSAITTGTYPLLLAKSTSSGTGVTYFDSGVTLNSADNIIATNISGNAATATRATTAGSADSVNWSGIQNKPSTFSPSSHTHAIADVNGLQSALDGKAATSHGTHVTFSTTAPVMDGTASVGSATTVARSDHKHPTDTSRAAASHTHSNYASTISVTGSGNAITAISQSGNTITATKGTTFATLTNGKIPSSQLPSYVDDVIEGYYNETDFYEDANFTSTKKITPESGKIYINLSNKKIYRYGGTNSGYVIISETLALGETSSTAYAGDKGKANADAITALNSSKADVNHNHDTKYSATTHTHDNRYYTETEINTKLSGKSDTSHTHSAYVNQNAFSNFKTGTTTISANSTTDTLELEAGSNITLTPNTSSKKITIAAKDTVYTHPTYTISKTTSTTSPSHGGTFTVIDSITTNTNGHTTAINTKTVTLPTDINTTYTLSSSKSATNTNTYLTLTPSSGSANNIQIKGTGATTISTDSNGVISINSPTVPTIPSLSKGTNTTKSKTLTHTETFSAITDFAISGHTITPEVTTFTLPSDTHYTSKNVVSNSSTGTSDVKSISNGSVYLNHIENSTKTSSHLIKGAGATTVTVDSSGVMTITSTDTNTGVKSVTSGSTNGTIKVNTNGTEVEVAVTGLGSAAYQNAITGAATTITSSNLTSDRVLVSNSSGKVAVSNITSTELGYLSGVTSPIQTQLNYKPGKIVTTEESDGGVSVGEVFNDLTSNVASGKFSHAEGMYATASGYYSHAEGVHTTASGYYSHAEGVYATASGNYSHAEGYDTLASGNYSHAEGNDTLASGYYSHAEGMYTTASGNYSHAEGYDTLASGNYQHVFGRLNIVDTSNSYIEIVGNGENTERSNARTLDWSGNEKISGTMDAASFTINNQKLFVIQEQELTNQSLTANTGFTKSVNVATVSGYEAISITGFAVSQGTTNGVNVSNVAVRAAGLNNKGVLFCNGKNVGSAAAKVDFSWYVLYVKSGLI